MGLSVLRICSAALAAACLSILLFSSHTNIITAVQAQNCSTALPFQSGDVVNIAILVWLIGQPHGLFTGDITDTAATNVTGYGTSLVQPFMLGIDFYVKSMRARGGILPLPSGGSVKLNFVYINMGATLPYSILPQATVDYSVVDPASNLPLHMIYTTYPGIPKSASSAGGLFDKVTSRDPVQLQLNYGVTQPFTYIIPSILLIDTPQTVLMNKVEDSRLAVVVAPFMSSREMFICDGKPAASSSTPDCAARSRRQGARRWQTQFSTLFDSTGNQNAALDSFHTLGVKTIVTITDDLTSSSTFAKWASANAGDSAAQLNINLLATFSTSAYRNCDPVKAPFNITDANCPPVSIMKSQTQVFPNRTALDIATQLSALNADALIILSAPRSPASWTFAQLFVAMKKVGYTPKAVSWGGGADNGIVPWLEDPSDLYNTWTTKPWTPELKGPIYKNYITQTNFELYPANATHDGPAVFADAFTASYGPGSSWGPTGHPMYDPLWTQNMGPPIAWGTMVIMQKLIEASETLDVPTILDKSRSVSTPGVYHQVQFDQYGRTARVNEILVQKTADLPIVLSPYNIGAQPLFPIPTWSERVFNPKFYSESNEKVMIAINSVCIFFALVLAALVFINRRSPVIRAATPSFCYVIIFGGILMLISNYFNTLVVDDAHCRASLWFLTLGFTCVFASLFIKTFRIWRIFGRAKLQVLKMKDSELLIAVASFLLIDVIINAAVTPSLSAARVYVDLARPAYDYMTCDYGAGIAAVYTHIAVKGGLLLFGVGLTFAVRNTPSQFNESSLIGMSIYNVSFVICFILPIVAVGLGGRRTTYLIRDFAIMFVVVTTLSLLYLPKFANIMGGVNSTVTPVSGLKTALQTATSNTPKTPNKSLRQPLGSEEGVAPEVPMSPFSNASHASGEGHTVPLRIVTEKVGAGGDSAASPTGTDTPTQRLPPVAEKYAETENTTIPNSVPQ